MTVKGVFWKWLLLVGLAALLAGCATNTVVPLRYQASTPPGGQICTQTLTLLPFADKRADTVSLGTLGEGKRFYAENDVSEWISWALFEELKARGCNVKYREKADKSATMGYVVSGSFDTVSLESGTTLMAKARLRLNVKLEKDGAFVEERTYSGERENIGLSYVDAAQKVLSATLQDLLQDAATNVVKAAK